MHTNNRWCKGSKWLGPCLLAALVLAGCMGRNGTFPWSETPAKDSLEHVTVATFEERVLKCEKPVLVDFYGDSCGWCVKLAPILEGFAEEHPEIRVVKVNVGENAELARRYGVSGIPKLLVFRGGQITANHDGFVPKSGIEALVASGAEGGSDKRS